MIWSARVRLDHPALITPALITPALITPALITPAQAVLVRPAAQNDIFWTLPEMQLRSLLSIVCLIAFLLAAPLTAQDRSVLSIASPDLVMLPRTPEEQALVAAVTAQTTTFIAAEPFEDKPAGAATVSPPFGSDAFSQPSGNISFDHEALFRRGNRVFNKIWVAAPATTLASDGLGPLYNARSCQTCHLKDGRGHPPLPGEPAISLLLRLSLLDTDQNGAPFEHPDPMYGSQLQGFAVDGVQAEYQLHLEYEEHTVTMGDSEVIHLRTPTYQPMDLQYGPLAGQAVLSPRVAPPMIGLGLLEAVLAADILANADPQDRDGDGISGRANTVPFSTDHQLGRFGLKAGVATLSAQIAAAFSADMGLSTPLHPQAWGDCTPLQQSCRSAPDGADAGTEVTPADLDLVTFYSQNLGVPARRDPGSAMVLQGKRLFYAAGCPSCHVPKFVTARLTNQPEQSFQLIWPYSDLLLHDMGAGLADNRPEADANGTEWRTPPLWGIGLTRQVSGRETYLHDGRARSITEAILWHGGEAEAARRSFAQLSKPDRAALLRFLSSL